MARHAKQSTHDHAALEAQHRALLVDVGLHVTTPRLGLLSCFALSDKQHLTVEEVHERMRRRRMAGSIATIYRTLNQLAELGVLVRTTMGEGSTVFELYSDGAHDHIACAECGRIDDLPRGVLTEYRQDVEKRSGYRFHGGAPLTLLGCCPSCDTVRRRRTPLRR